MGGEGKKQMDDGCRWLVEGEKKVWKWKSIRIWPEIAEYAVESEPWLAGFFAAPAQTTVRETRRICSGES